MDRRQLVPADGVANPHRGEWVVTADREVFGHALDEPERQTCETLKAAAASRLGDVVLERVHELVSEHVVSIPIRARERHDHPVLQRFGHTTGAFADEPGQRVGLLEVRMVRVQNDRLGLFELVLECTREALVPALTHAGRVVDRLGLFRIEVEVEVIGSKDLEIKIVELDLIASEVLR